MELEFSILKTKRGYDGIKIYMFQNVQQSSEVSNCKKNPKKTVEADMN